MKNTNTKASKDATTVTTAQAVNSAYLICLATTANANALPHYIWGLAHYSLEDMQLQSKAKYLKKELKTLSESINYKAKQWNSSSFSTDYKAYRLENIKPLEDRKKELVNELEVIEHKQIFNRHNFKNAFANYCESKRDLITAVLEKYINKPLGERTESKLKAEIISILNLENCNILINCGTLLSEASLTVLWIRDNQEGIMCEYSFTKLFLGDGHNKILKVLDTLSETKPCIEDYDKVIENQVKVKDEIISKATELQKLLDEYNNIGTKSEYVTIGGNVYEWMRRKEYEERLKEGE